MGHRGGILATISWGGEKLPGAAGGGSLAVPEVSLFAAVPRAPLGARGGAGALRGAGSERGESGVPSNSGRGAKGWTGGGRGLWNPVLRGSTGVGSEFPSAAAKAPARKEGLAAGRGVCGMGWGVLAARGLGDRAGCGNGPDPGTHKRASPSRCGACPPFSSAPQTSVGFPCQGPGCEARLAWGVLCSPSSTGSWWGRDVLQLGRSCRRCSPGNNLAACSEAA